MRVEAVRALRQRERGTLMKNWLSKKGSRLLVMLSERRKLASYTDPEAHRRVAPGQDSRLPSNHTRTSGGNMGVGGPF